MAGIFKNSWYDFYKPTERVILKLWFSTRDHLGPRPQWTLAMPGDVLGSHK